MLELFPYIYSHLEYYSHRFTVMFVTEMTPKPNWHHKVPLTVKFLGTYNFWVTENILYGYYAEFNAV